MTMSTRKQAVGTVQIDDARMRVTEWRFAPGAATGFHRHEHDYCVVPLTTGTLRIESGDGVSEAGLVAGRSYARKAGVEHDVINANAFEFVFIEIELKEPAKGPSPA
jgi:quercetin dioxygenase-like cupin family protein